MRICGMDCRARDFGAGRGNGTESESSGCAGGVSDAHAVRLTAMISDAKNRHTRMNSPHQMTANGMLQSISADILVLRSNFSRTARPYNSKAKSKQTGPRSQWSTGFAAQDDFGFT
jgi:hypothetical protein